MIIGYVVILLVLLLLLLRYMACEEVPYVPEEEPILDGYEHLNLEFATLEKNATSNENMDPAILTKEMPDTLSLTPDNPNGLKECDPVHENNSIAEEPDILESEESLAKWYLKNLTKQFLCLLNYLKVVKKMKFENSLW